jgi:hypothetical protein|tara:strand:+ start:216 stop:368 length:153 start_codon:yes stop_codon:yes gene_type:complete
MRPFKDYVHQRREDDNTRVVLEVTDDDIVSGIITMVALGIILGAMMGLAI